MRALGAILFRLPESRIHHFFRIVVARTINRGKSRNSPIILSPSIVRAFAQLPPLFEPFENHVHLPENDPIEKKS